MMLFRKLGLFVVTLCVVFAAHGAVPDEDFRDALWVAESHGVLKLLVAKGGLEVEIDSAEEVRAVAVDAVAGRVWVAKPAQLAAYGFDGELALQVALEPTRRAADHQLLSVDRRDGTVWLAGGRQVRAFDFDGTDLGSSSASGTIQAISLAEQAGRRWLAGKQQAELRNEQGEVLTTLTPPRGEKLQDLAYDAVHHALWLLTNKQLYFYDLAEQQSAWQVAERDAQRIRLLDGEGAWVAGDRRLSQYDPFGEQLGTFEYDQPGNLVEFVVDGVDSSLWLATQQHLGHYRPDGTVIDRLPFTDGGHTGRLWSLDMYIDDIPPSVRFALPAPGTLTNDNQLPFVLEYSDVGIGTDPATIAFTVNEADAVFECTEQDQGSSRCTPGQILPEGENRVSATADDFNGNVSEPAQVDVTVDTIPPTITVTAPEDGSEVTDSPVTVSGHLSEPASISIDGEDVLLDAELAFSTDVSLDPGSNTIQLVAIDPAGNAAQGELTVVLREDDVPPDPAQIAPPVDPSKPTNVYDTTRFLYEGPDPIQTDVEPGVIEARRVVVLRGQVFDREGEPLPGVTVRAHGHPEYGSTQTRADGLFDLVVNGGGTITLEYEKAGYMPVQRATRTPWRDYRWLPDVVMSRYDDQVTRIDLNADRPMQTARGSTVTDADGERTATVMFPVGVSAEMVLPDGSRQPLDILDVRATEYTVGPNGPEAMPGELPPTSAYTYAVELSVDQALDASAPRVEFSGPVPFYVDNFLDFPAGIDVPTGYYDRDKAQWIASEDGRVVEVLDIDDGRAVLDVTGAGNPATAEELAALQINDAELAELAEHYEVGQSLWRAPITHFTPWDCNWPYTFPEDAEPPEDRIEQPDQQEDDPTECDGSIVACQNQVLGKRIDIAGTPFTLNYRSNRAPGRRNAYRVEIPVTGSSVPDSVKRVEATVNVLGRRFSRQFDTRPNQTWTFEWDGKDAFGREPLGAQYAIVTTRYVYDAVYVESRGEFAASFGKVGQTDRVLSDRSRGEVAMEQSMRIPIGVWDARILGLGGWTVDVHHAYEQLTRQLFRGDGITRRGSNMNQKVTRSAGNEQSFYDSTVDNHNVLATEANFETVNGIAVAPDGDIYIAAGYSHSANVYKVDAVTAKITEFAGNDFTCLSLSSCQEEGLATDVAISRPSDVAIGPDGNVFIADRYGIVKVAPDGYLERMLVEPGISHRGRLWSVDDLVVDSNGNLYYSIWNAVKQLDTSGNVTVVAGEPATSGYAGDGDPASEALFNEIADLSIGPDGAIYVADMRNHVVRRIATDGTITVVAGTPGVPGFAGNGGPAIDALLHYPQAVEVDGQGNLFVSDTLRNSDVRKVGPDGTIYTVAGIIFASGWVDCIPEWMDEDEFQYCEDDIYARKRAFNTITGLAVDGESDLYISDRWGRHVYKVQSPMPEFSPDEVVVPDRQGEQAYIFDRFGKHLKTIEVNTGSDLYTFDYDGHGFLAGIVDRHGNQTKFRRDTLGNLLAIIGPFGQKTALTADENGYLARIEGPLGQSHTFTYDDGLLIRARDPNGNVSHFDYDAEGRLVADSDPVGGGWTLSRNDLGDDYEVTTRSAENWSIQHRVEREDDGTRGQIFTAPHGGSSMSLEIPDGTATSTTPDGVTIDSRMAPHPILGPAAPFVAEATMSLPGGQSLAVERTLEFSGDRETPFGEHDLDETVTVNGRAYHSHYDAGTRTWTRTSPEGRTSRVQLNEKGEVVSSRLGSLEGVSNSYDSHGRLSGVSQGTRHVSLAYDGNGYLSRVVDAELRATVLDNDRVGRTRELHLPGGRLVAFDFDANGNVTGITPPERPSHGFDYNGVDLATRYTPPPVGETDGTVATDYRLDRTVGGVTRADGGSVDLTYGNTSGLLAGIAAPSADYDYEYLPNSDRLASATGPAGQQLDYAWNGPLVEQVTWSGEISGQVGYAWDDNFWLEELTINGQVIDYGYDDDGLVTGAGTLSLDYASGVPLLKGTQLGNVQSSWSYNPFGEPRSYEAGLAEGPEFFRTEFTRDQLGRITEKVETVFGVETTYAYAYDPAGRLIEVRQDGIVVDRYTYDANGNRLSHDGTTGIYDAQDRLLSYGDFDYTYTPDGELQTRTDTATGETTRYTYDAFSNLRQVTLPDGTEIEYVIDAQNRRIGKKINGVLTQGFLYADQLNPVAELDGEGEIRSVFIYASRLNVPDYMIKVGRTYRIIADHLGSVRLVVDTETGEIVQEMDYSAFGQVTKDTNPGFQPFGFAGGLYDRDTRLVRFGVRDYDPHTGRWTAKDPIRFQSGDTNLLAYVANDPINLIDPFGLAEACYRPLRALPIAVLGNSVDENANTVIGHEHIFFDDGNDIGYGPDGIYSGEDKSEFVRCEDLGGSKGEILDLVDDIRKEFEPDDYTLRPASFGGNNCQDFVEEIRNGLR